MAFLSGSLSFERFRVVTPEVNAFGEEHLEKLQSLAVGEFQPGSEETVKAGFLAGSHLFDSTFELEKNIIHDALHFAMRVDTNQVPSAIRKAWSQMELAALQAENPHRKATKSEKEQVKESVEQRAQAEASSGKYHRMNQFPVLWDAPSDMVYFGGSNSTACGLFADLMTAAFDMELERVSVGYLAAQWAEQHGTSAALDVVRPTVFHPEHTGGDAEWANSDSPQPDFLGNEFLLWLWYMTELESDTLKLSDDTEVTVMFSKSLSLECPAGLSGRETISSEIPTRLPEAMEAIRSGKLPRKAGLTLVRLGQQYELTLQAETFSISGARVQKDDDAEGREVLESRIDAIRQLNQTIDLLFEVFCRTRLSTDWADQVEKISQWVSPLHPERKRKAA
jgi:hypothetical protein